VGDWQLFDDPRFEVRFSYPAVAPAGDTVVRKDDDFRGAPRVHLTSSEGLYLEVVRFTGLTPEDEYRDHRAYLEHRFGAGAVTALTARQIAGCPGWTYGFAWPGGERERLALLVQTAGALYRLISDPRAPLNHRVLATLEVPA
jgi:hypothetical protein